MTSAFNFNKNLLLNSGFGIKGGTGNYTDNDKILLAHLFKNDGWLHGTVDKDGNPIKDNKSANSDNAGRSEDQYLDMGEIMTFLDKLAGDDDKITLDEIKAWKASNEKVGGHGEALKNMSAEEVLESSEHIFGIFKTDAKTTQNMTAYEPSNKTTNINGALTVDSNNGKKTIGYEIVGEPDKSKNPWTQKVRINGVDYTVELTSDSANPFNFGFNKVALKDKSNKEVDSLPENDIKNLKSVEDAVRKFIERMFGKSPASSDRTKVGDNVNTNSVIDNRTTKEYGFQLVGDQEITNAGWTQQVRINGELYTVVLDQKGTGTLNDDYVYLMKNGQVVCEMTSGYSFYDMYDATEVANKLYSKYQFDQA